MADLIHKKKKLTSFQIIILGSAGDILVGALLLMPPISTKGGNLTPFNQALFTSTSAVCVTGLVVQDTATYLRSFPNRDISLSVFPYSFPSIRVQLYYITTVI